MKVTEYRYMTEIERRVTAETKLEYIEKDLKYLLDKRTFLKDEIQPIYDKYFKKSLVEKVEYGMLGDVVDVQE